MRVVLDGVDLPGRTFCEPDGTPIENVHVGVQVRLTDARGGPRCARVDPPDLEWSLG